MRHVLAVLLLASVALACGVEVVGVLTQVYQGQDQWGAPRKYAVVGGESYPITESLYIQLVALELPAAVTLTDAEGCDGVYDQHH